jgi:hypothetical protein
MAGQPVRCKACGSQFVVPPAPGTVRPGMPAQAPVSAPLGGSALDNLGNLGDLSAFASPTTSNYASAPAAYMTAAPAARKTRKKMAIKKSTLVTIGLSALVVVAIIGIGIAGFVFFPYLPIGFGYSSPQAVWEAQKKAMEDRDWKTLYHTVTAETSDQMVGGIALVVQMMGAMDTEMAAIRDKHGLASNAPATPTSPADFASFVTQMEQQAKSAASSISDKEGFFVEVMDFLIKKGESMQQKLGNESMMMKNIPQELKDVVIEGDRARGKQTVSVMGRTLEVPVEFRKVNGGWRIHASVTAMGS